MCYKCGTDDETYNPETDSCNSCMPNLKPHKHAFFIKAWADGLHVQKRYIYRPEWGEIAEYPSWTDEYEYRIKPKTIKYRNALMMGGKGFDGYVISCNQNPERIEQNEWFIKWLGDWQEVEV